MDATAYEVILGEIPIRKAIIREIFENLDILPSNRDLAGAEIELIGTEDMQYIVRKELKKVKK